MRGNVTQEELIKFVYGELSFQETADLYDRIDNEPESLSDLEAYADLKLVIGKPSLRPSEKVLERLMKSMKQNVNLKI